MRFAAVDKHVVYLWQERLVYSYHFIQSGNCTTVRLIQISKRNLEKECYYRNVFLMSSMKGRDKFVFRDVKEFGDIQL